MIEEDSLSNGSVNRLPAVICGLACLASLAAVGFALSEAWIAAAACAAASAIVCGSTAGWLFTTGPSINPSVVEKTATFAEQRRRLVLYEPQTGLLARWYFDLRFHEECVRAARYGHALTLLTLEFERPSGELTVRLAEWLLRHVRESDMLGHNTDHRLLVALTSTGDTGAEHFAGRLALSFGSVRVGVANFPQDGDSLEKLVDAAAATATPALSRFSRAA